MLNPAWIQCFLFDCRSPHGERGLKFVKVNLVHVNLCRSPHGERGLKYIDQSHLDAEAVSLPAWGAWIEIDFCHGNIYRSDTVAPRMGSVD